MIHHLEMVMPPSGSLVHDIATTLAPYNEDNEHATGHRLLEHWRIGGRFSGDKLLAQLGHHRVSAFYDILNQHGVKVHGVSAGKQRLLAQHVELVDSLWREHFPDSGIDACPLFDQSNHVHSWGSHDWRLPGDVMTMRECPPDFTADDVLVAYGRKAAFGVSLSNEPGGTLWDAGLWAADPWDGTIGHALALYSHIGQLPIESDWLAVTLNCNSVGNRHI